MKKLQRDLMRASRQHRGKTLKHFKYVADNQIEVVFDDGSSVVINADTLHTEYGELPYMKVEL